MEPWTREQRRVSHQIIEEQRAVKARVERRIGEEKRTKECESDTDAADEEILPSCFERTRVLVEI
jgi:hypothetical protein